MEVSNLKFNTFAHDDALKQKYLKVSYLLSHGGTTIRNFISDQDFRSNFGICGMMNGASCKQEFIDAWFDGMSKKSQALGDENSLYTKGFKSALVSDFGQRDLLPPFLAAMNKQSFILFLFQSNKFFGQRNFKAMIRSFYLR